MTTETPALEPLWTDNDIANDAKRADSSPTVQAKIRACLLFMRHGYEAYRQRDKERIAKLQQGWDYATKYVIELETKIEALEAALAEAHESLMRFGEEAATADEPDYLGDDEDD